MDRTGGEEGVAPVGQSSPARNWSAEWRERQALRRRFDDVSFWDERSRTFTEKDAPSAYVAEFLRLAAVRLGESVFDMGCGAGDITVPLAEAGCSVTAADFSRGMLGVLSGKLKRRGLAGVSPVLMSWDDDWRARGFEPRSFDVCLASRSLSVDDLEGALLKLDGLARRRVCVTISAGSSPRCDERVMSALGLTVPAGQDHLFALGILAEHGICAKSAIINSTREDSFESLDAAFAYYTRMVEGSTAHGTPNRIARALDDLREWLPTQLVEIEPESARGPNDADGPESPHNLAGPTPRLHMREPRVIPWAFISWDVR